MKRMLAIYFQNEIFVFLLKQRGGGYRMILLFKIMKTLKTLSWGSSPQLLWVTDIQFSSSDVSGMMYYQNFGCFSGIVPEIVK